MKPLIRLSSIEWFWLVFEIVCSIFPLEIGKCQTIVQKATYKSNTLFSSATPHLPRPCSPIVFFQFSFTVLLLWLCYFNAFLVLISTFLLFFLLDCVRGRRRRIYHRWEKRENENWEWVFPIFCYSIYYFHLNFIIFLPFFQYDQFIIALEYFSEHRCNVIVIWLC